jgi:hypothetical protein
MKRYLEAGVLLVVTIASLAAADDKKEAAKPDRSAETRGVVSILPKKAPNINDPGASIAQRLLEMTPEQRERALEKFPPDQQARIRQTLEKLDARPPKQKERLIQEYHALVRLPPDKQLLVRRQVQAFNRMPDERKLIVGPELQRLRLLPEEQREARLDSDDFKNKFTPAEQRMMEDVSRYLPLQ